ncbi:MAG: hypothetical protein NTY45_05935 [Elusimicrobia bacterium]|nr:hypothetical protein [Elusimicrobiota bacterium]
MTHNKSASKTTFAAVLLSLVCALQAPASAGSVYSPFSGGQDKSSLAEQISGQRAAGVNAPAAPKPAKPAVSAPRTGLGFNSADGTKHIWPEILFLRGADYAEFAYTMSQNRDMVRRMLMQEFGDIMIPLAASNADMNELAKTIANIILTFDEMHNKHKDEAVQGIQISFENQFRAEIDELYRAYSLSDDQRKVDFLYAGAPVVKDVKAHSQRASLPMDIFNSLDYVLYGSYTLLGGANISVTLTVEKIKTGEMRTFEVTAPINTAMKQLARKFFDFFQSNDYAEWVNPQPNLQWIPSPPHAAAYHSHHSQACLLSFYENVYALIRKPETPQKVRAALECILFKLGDFGAREEFSGAFPTVENAVAFLAKEGYSIQLPD